MSTPPAGAAPPAQAAAGPPIPRVAPAELPGEALYRPCDVGRMRFATTAELDGDARMVGHARALEGLAFGIALRCDGYNVFALGPPGVGKHATVRRLLEQRAATEPAPSDWAYVHDFADAHRPRCLRLPPGRAAALARDMGRLADELRAAIPTALTSDEHRSRRKLVEDEFRQRSEKLLSALEQQAAARGVALLRTPVGVALAPVHDGQVYEPEEFLKLPAPEQERYRQELAELQERLQGILSSLPRWDRERRGRLREVEREVTGLAAGHLIDEVRARWADVPDVLEHLDAVQRDVLDSPSEVRVDPDKGEPGPRDGALEARLRRYRVNVLVEHAPDKGAPVVYEDHPTQPNVVGRVEHRSEMGTLVTDFQLVKPGALHHANGGYLILDARKLLVQPLAWESLKRALRSHQIRIESLGQAASLISTITLDPAPIPLDVKVVLVGEPWLYYLLSAADPDFPDLFKVAADFEDRVPRTPEMEDAYALLVGSVARRRGLRALDRLAVARTIEHAARLSDRSDALSTEVQAITDLLQESDHHAARAGADVIRVEHVAAALAAQVHRADRIRERINEEIQRGTILVETRGLRIGQVNGLAVSKLGTFSFGRPNRITARVRVGAGHVVDIEREVALGGPIHSKGVLILSGFLGARYAPDRPLALAASLVFEQSYGGIDGDSASLAELLALLSALAAAPLRQSVAVTGSVDQHGGVQPVGGVNEKIEGFFDACRAQALTGEQGVVVPAANRASLMLREDVREAVAAGRFHIWAVASVDEAIELLTGEPAGVVADNGLFPADTVNRRVQDRLLEMAEKARAWRSPAAGH